MMHAAQSPFLVLNHLPLMLWKTFSMLEELSPTIPRKNKLGEINDFFPVIDTLGVVTEFVPLCSLGQTGF